MKVKILLKNINEGVGKNGQPYCIKSLYACVSTKEDANALAVQAIADGVPSDKIKEVIKQKEYEGVTNYGFGLNCSHFTFDRVERFGVLDATVEFIVNKDGFVNPKIKVVDKIEQVFGYEAPEKQEDDVTGWATQTQVPEPIKVEPMGDGSHAEPNPVVDFAKLAAESPEAGTDLPF